MKTFKISLINRLHSAYRGFHNKKAKNSNNSKHQSDKDQFCKVQESI